MSQKTNKIIVLIAILIFIGVIIYLITLKFKLSLKPTTLPSPIVDLNTYEGKVNLLLNDCLLPEEFLMNICRYTPLQTVVSINEDKEIERNNQKTTIPVVHFGDLDIFKVNLSALISQDKYKDISNKLPQSFKLCIQINPLLEKIKAYPDSIFNVSNNNIFCTRALNKTDSLQFSFIGYIPYPNKENEELSINFYLVPKEETLTSNLISLYQYTPLVSLIPSIIEK
ncbi:MAG: hypothetical protein ACP5OX_02040 [Minisyncoccia bacterium]